MSEHESVEHVSLDAISVPIMAVIMGGYALLCILVGGGMFWLSDALGDQEHINTVQSLKQEMQQVQIQEMRMDSATSLQKVTSTLEATAAQIGRLTELQMEGAEDRQELRERLQRLEIKTDNEK